MIRVLAFLLIATPALAATGDPPPQACITKDMHRATVWLEHPRDILTDIAGPVEQFLIANLLIFEARDHRGSDLVLVRRWGSPMTRITAFTDGCRSADYQLHNHYVQVLQRMPKDWEG